MATMLKLVLFVLGIACVYATKSGKSYADVSENAEVFGDSAVSQDEIDISRIISNPSFQIFLDNQINLKVNRRIKELLGVDYDNLVDKRINKICKKPANTIIGSNYTCDGLRGPPGPRGPQGPRGPKGDSGTGGVGLSPPSLEKSRLIVQAKANISQSVSVSCSFYGNPIPNITWVLNARRYYIKNTVMKNVSIIESTAYIRDITWEDRGNITCIATNMLGQAKAHGNLTVYSAPSILPMPKTAYATLGVPYVFHFCNASAYPPARITWERFLGEFDWYRFRIRYGSMNVTRVKASDEGFYICTAKNVLGSAKAYVQLRIRPFKLAVQPPFYVILRPDRNNNKLFCGAYGDSGRMRGQWFQNDLQIMTTYHRRNLTYFEVSALASSSGIYKCQITFDGKITTATTFVKEFSFQSEILREDQSLKLYEWIHEKRNVSIAGFKPCWQMKENVNISRQVYQRYIYLRHCDKEKQTILVVKDVYGNVFGGFIGSHGNEFLFDFRKSLKFPKLMNVTTAPSCNVFGPCFYGDLNFTFKDIREGNSGYVKIYIKSHLNRHYDGWGYNYLGEISEARVASFEVLQEAHVTDFIK